MRNRPSKPRPKRTNNPYRRDIIGQTIMPGLEWWDRNDPDADIPGQVFLDFGDGMTPEPVGSVVR